MEFDNILRSAVRNIDDGKTDDDTSSHVIQSHNNKLYISKCIEVYEESRTLV